MQSREKSRAGQDRQGKLNSSKREKAKKNQLYFFLLKEDLLCDVRVCVNCDRLSQYPCVFVVCMYVCTCTVGMVQCSE